MKKVFTVVLILALMCGCAGQKQENKEVYYLKRIMFHDSFGNRAGIYNADRIGAQDSILTLYENGKVEFDYYYHNELTFSKKGSLSVKEGEEDGTVLFEGDGTSYLLTSSESDDGKISKYLVYLYDDVHYAGMTFDGEKEEKYEGEIQDIVFEDQDPFTESDIYKSLTEKFEDTLFTCYFDEASQTFFVSYKAPDKLAYVIRNAPDQIRESFDKMCSSVLNVGETCRTAISLGGYKQVKCVARILSDESDEEYLYIVEDGKEVYKEAYGNGTKPSSPVIEDHGSDFEHSASYKKIKENTVDAFAGFDTNLIYKEDENTLTFTIVAPKGTAAGVLSGNAKMVSEWYGWTSSLADLSNNCYLLMSQDGYGEIAFMIMVLSDANTSNAIYATMNGVDFYNFAD